MTIRPGANSFILFLDGISSIFCKAINILILKFEYFVWFSIFLMLSASGIQTWMAGTKAKCPHHLTFWNHLHQCNIYYLEKTKGLFQCFVWQDEFESWDSQNITLMFYLPHSFRDSFHVSFWPQCWISIFRICIKIFQPDKSGFPFLSRFFDPVNNRIGLICDLIWSKSYRFSYKAKQTLFRC